MASRHPATPPPLRPFDRPLLVRTDFSDDRVWQALHTTVRTPSEEDFLADVDVVDDTAYRNATPAQLRDLITAGPDGPGFFFVVDHVAVTSPGHPVLVVPVPHPDPGSDPEHAGMGHEERLAAREVLEEERLEFRVVAGELWSVENNLSLANMDWSEFADAVDDDGVFRAFRD